MPPERPSTALESRTCACSRAAPAPARRAPRRSRPAAGSRRRCPERLVSTVTTSRSKAGSTATTRPWRIQRQAAPVEDQFVVAADLVHVHERARRAPGVLARSAVAHALLAHVKGRGGDIEQQGRALRGQLGHRVAVVEQAPWSRARGRSRRPRRCDAQLLALEGNGPDPRRRSK